MLVSLHRSLDGRAPSASIGAPRMMAIRTARRYHWSRDRRLYFDRDTSFAGTQFRGPGTSHLAAPPCRASRTEISRSTPPAASRHSAATRCGVRSRYSRPRPHRRASHHGRDDSLHRDRAVWNVPHTGAGQIYYWPDRRVDQLPGTSEKIWISRMEQKGTGKIATRNKDRTPTAVTLCPGGLYPLQSTGMSPGGTQAPAEVRRCNVLLLENNEQVVSRAVAAREDS